MRLWLEQGCVDVDAQDERGLTALMVVTWESTAAARQSAVLSVNRLLLEYGANANARDMMDLTPLSYAIHSKLAEVVRVLLEYGADPNATVLGGVRLLESIANDCFHEELTDLLKYLLKFGANPFVPGRDGRTAATHLQQTDAGRKFIVAHPQWFTDRRT